MKKSPFWARYVLPSLALFTVSCKTGFVVNPTKDIPIYKDMGGPSGPNEIHYSCFLSVVNFKEVCNLSYATTMQHLQLAYPTVMPVSIPANTHQNFEFTITGIDPAACTATCPIDVINWTGVYATTSQMQTSEITGTGTFTTRYATWLFSDGDPNLYFRGNLSVNYKPDVGGGGPQLNWDQIGDIYNPNDFPIDVKTAQENPSPTYDCLFNGSGKDIYGATIQPHSLYHFGDAIRAKYSKACLVANPDANIFIQSSTMKFTPNPQGAAAIEIFVSLIK